MQVGLVRQRRGIMQTEEGTHGLHPAEFPMVSEQFVAQEERVPCARESEM